MVLTFYPGTTKMKLQASQSLFKKKLANYWMHNGMIQIEGKMSKSLGNFATIRELTATFEPEVIRFFILQSHYRQEVVSIFMKP